MMTVLANMRINSVERLEQMKASFESFSGASDDWLINIRGSERGDAIAYLKERLGDRGIFFELLDDPRGWAENMLDMLQHAKHAYVLVWTEDHINIGSEDDLRDVVEEMEKERVECLTYTIWGVDWHDAQLAAVSPRRGRAIDVATIDENNWREVLRVSETPPYLVSLQSIYEKDFFKKLLLSERRRLPFWITPLLFRVFALLRRMGVRMTTRAMFYALNSVCGHRLHRFPKEGPFDLERGSDRFDLLPLRVGLLKKELFACIDDDMGVPGHTYSLVSRGQYPLRDRLLPWQPTETLEQHSRSTRELAKGEVLHERYCFYDADKHVRTIVVREHVGVMKGRVRITVGDEQLELDEGEGACFFTNIAHEIRALTDAEIARFVPRPGAEPYYFSE